MQCWDVVCLMVQYISQCSIVIDLKSYYMWCYIMSLWTIQYVVLFYICARLSWLNCFWCFMISYCLVCHGIFVLCSVRLYVIVQHYVTLHGCTIRVLLSSCQIVLYKMLVILACVVKTYSRINVCTYFFNYVIFWYLYYVTSLCIMVCMIYCFRILPSHIYALH